ncbi:hypothetical protein K5D43_01055 [Pseudomonas cichorii]|uniref:hypothetical protein n=1 Tax=Pseudomonas cichorii TaxID=36746 RepID=UPI00190FBFB0|nr:hypothetical protein [Pseudomonas cichorii]
MLILKDQRVIGVNLPSFNPSLLYIPQLIHRVRSEIRKIICITAQSNPHISYTTPSDLSRATDNPAHAGHPHPKVETEEGKTGILAIPPSPQDLGMQMQRGISQLIDRIMEKSGPAISSQAIATPGFLRPHVTVDEMPPARRLSKTQLKIGDMTWQSNCAVPAP